MGASVELLALYAAVQTRRRLSAELKLLRARLQDEKLRDEWRRMVRIRHYLTLGVLKDHTASSWADTWAHGTDKNLINLTSLSRDAFAQLLERFKAHYDIPVITK
ncbi:hypothetical protein PF011_g28576 [Phytophthora fragariae]|uniref:Uncharacterized protein n=1 Tax=Phytophthora fragariae TaxID=53985 RepID=A0A6A3H6K6_9STRA|nr:hypothetical protein PF011_g28576 [Phytophthora fragariae]